MTDVGGSRAARIAVLKMQQNALNQSDPLAWFEALYARAAGDATVVPWADLEPNPHLVQWVTQAKPALAKQNVLVVGCGLGDDAEYLASLGATVSAFDLSPSAINWAKQRFPESTVAYQAYDLFTQNPDWVGKFDLIVEIYTLQAINIDLRCAAMPILANYLAATGQLLVICRGAPDGVERPMVPWPLTPSELAHFEAAGLQKQSHIDIDDGGVPRWRIVYMRS